MACMTSSPHHILGIDIGGSGIKGAPVDLSTGALTGSRIRIPTPKKSTPKACASVVAQIVESVTNQSHPIAGITSTRLLAAGRPNGILYGPRSPNFQKDGGVPR